MNPNDHLIERRHFCTSAGAGFGSLALLSLLGKELAHRALGDDFSKSPLDQGVSPMVAKPPMIPTKAKSVIFFVHVRRAVSNGSVRLQA